MGLGVPLLPVRHSSSGAPPPSLRDHCGDSERVAWAGWGYWGPGHGRGLSGGQCRAWAYCGSGTGLEEGVSSVGLGVGKQSRKNGKGNL